MSIYTYIKDSLQSVTSGMGQTKYDKLATASYSANYLNDDELINTYKSSWISKKIVDVPAYDSLRKWRIWQGDNDHTDQLVNLENQLDVQRKVLECKISARLFGGAVIFLGTGQDVEKPLNLNAVKKGDLKYLTVMSRLDVTAGELEQDPFSPNYGKPAYYQIRTGATDSAQRIDPSHFVIQLGVASLTPWYEQGTSFGWGNSVLQSTYQAIKNLDSMSQNIASLVFEANVDVFGVPNLMASVSDVQYQKDILERFRIASTSKSVNRTLLHDAAETYDRKGASFSDLPDLLDRYFLMACGAADVPITRLFGDSPSGLSGSGESEIKNYYDSVRSLQSLEIEPTIATLDECLIRSALGNRPPELKYNWVPLQEMDETEISQMGLDTSNTVKNLASLGLFTNEELRTVTSNRLTELTVFPDLKNEVNETDNSDPVDFEQIEDIPETDNDESRRDADV